MDKSEILDLLMSYKDDMYRVALGIVSNHSDAESILFEAIEKVYKHRKKIKETSFTKTYAIRTVINLSKDHLKSRKLYVSYDDALTPLQASTDYSFIYDSIEKLPTDLKELIVLHYITGFTFAEISDITQAPQSTIKSRVKKALTLLKVDMEDIYES